MSSRSTSPEETRLTGRDRLAALLAAGSDNENSGDEDVVPRRKILMESDEESEEEIRPRGRFAAQMLGEENEKMQEGSDEDKEKEEEAGLTVRDRMRRRLLEEEKKEKEKEKKENHKSPESDTMAKDTQESTQAGEPEDPEADREALTAASKNPRLQVLLARKRAENAAREAEEAAKRAARQPVIPSDAEGDGDIDMGEVGDDMAAFLADAMVGRLQKEKTRTEERKRPEGRKASKKAVEEMRRETERMKRGMQLGVDVKTKKKFEKKMLFDIFGFKSGNNEAEKEVVYMEGMEGAATVVEAVVDEEKEREKAELERKEKEKQDKRERLKKRKEEALAAMMAEKEKEKQAAKTSTTSAAAPAVDDPKGDVEIIDPAIDRLSRVVVRKDKMDPGLVTLLQFQSNLEDHSVKMKTRQVQEVLRKKAREQIKKEAEERMAALKAKGIMVMTEEEREREAEVREDMLAKAREEDERLRRREREERRRNGEEDEDDLLSDDEFDGDYGEGEGEDEEGEMPLILSGSEDEDEEDKEEEEQEKEGKDGDFKMGGASDDEEENLLLKVPRSQKKKTQVLSDDENDSPDIIPSTQDQTTVKAAFQTPTRPAAASTTNANNHSPVPGSVIRSAKKTFIPGLPVASEDLDMESMFAGTINDGASQAASQDFARSFPEATMPDFTQGAFPLLPDSQADLVGRGDVVPSTQPGEEGTEAESLGIDTQGIVGNFNLRFSQMGEVGSQMSQLQLTQDQGINVEPIRERFVKSRVESPVAEGDVEGAEKKQKARKLKSKDEAVREKLAQQEDEFGFGTTTKASTLAMDRLKEAAKQEWKRKKMERKMRKAMVAKNSEAKGMVDEQAEESDDEYAGLGGDDGEDSDDDSDAASVQEMIDDETKTNTAEEARLAAFYNERELAEEEAGIQKLFRDINNGGLRRKRGADYDLDDSESDGERARRIKRKQHEKIMRELMGDGTLAKTAEKAGAQAYVEAITSEYIADEIPIIEMDGQSEEDEAAMAVEVHPGEGALPVRKNRKKEYKPVSVQEVRSQLIELLDDPWERAAVAGEAMAEDEQEKENQGGGRVGVLDEEGDGMEIEGEGMDKISAAPRFMRKPGSQVIDRLSLKRSQSSVSTGSSSTTSSRLAFAAPGSSQSRTKSLLRGATSSLVNSAMANAASKASMSGTGSTTMGGVGDGASRIKKGATRGSGLSGFARENERRVAREEAEKRREEKKLKGAEKRVEAVRVMFDGGQWE